MSENEKIEAAMTSAMERGEVEKIEAAINVAMEYGQIDGSHHKAWVIDQMVRALTGGDENDEKYEALIAEYKNGEDGPETYEWDEGIAP